MRGGILATGIILLILGIIFFFSGQQMVRQVEAYDVYDLPISEVWKTVSSSARNQYETGQAMIMFGGIFGLVGLILCIGGIAAPGKTEQSKQIVIHEVNSKKDTHFDKDRMCTNCGRKIPFDARICPYCSKNFEIQKLDKQVIDKSKKNDEKKIGNKVDIKKTEKKELKTEALMYCPKCGNKLDENLIFCTYCGNKLR